MKLDLNEQGVIGKVEPSIQLLKEQFQCSCFDDTYCCITWLFYKEEIKAKEKWPIRVETREVSLQEDFNLPHFEIGQSLIFLKSWTILSTLD